MDRLLTVVALALTVAAVSAVYENCPPAQVMFLFDESENAGRASSTPASTTNTYAFDILKDSMTSFFASLSNYSSFSVGGYGYSGNSSQTNIFTPWITPAQAINNVSQIGSGEHGGSWTARGFEKIQTGPTLQNSWIMLISSQGSGTQARRNQTLREYKRVIDLGWNVACIGVQGSNIMDLEELRSICVGNNLTIINDTVPANPADPKSYKFLLPALANFVNSTLCLNPITTTSSSTTTTTSTITPSVTDSGLCSQCLFEAGYGFDSDPLFCDTFYQCVPNSAPIKKQCPDGTLWDGSKCNHAEKVTCEQNPCNSNTPAGTVYASGKCCNKFYQCNSGQMVLNSCPKGQIYYDELRACQTPPGDVVEVCRNVEKYYCDIDQNAPRDCAGYSPDLFGDPCSILFYGNKIKLPAGTNWNQSKCAIVFNDGRDQCVSTNETERILDEEGPAAVCNSVFLADYNGGSLAVYSERLQKQLNVYVTTQEALLTNNAVTFTREMRSPFAYYYFFNSREFANNIAFKLRFRLDNPQISTVYDILSNLYCSQCVETVSFTVTAASALRYVVTATFVTTFGDTISSSAIIDIRDQRHYVELIFIFGDNSIYGKVYALDDSSAVYQTADFTTINKSVDARIAVTKCGILIGRGSNQHLVGAVDQFSFYEYCQNITSVLR